jgi:hypothetical protein
MPGTSSESGVQAPNSYSPPAYGIEVCRDQGVGCTMGPIQATVGTTQQHVICMALNSITHTSPLSHEIREE